MTVNSRLHRLALIVAAGAFLCVTGDVAGEGLDLGPEELVQYGSVTIDVSGFSVPSLVDWNDDGRNDLIVGTGGGGSFDAMVLVYRNFGTTSDPVLVAPILASTAGGSYIGYQGDECIPCACMGLFPRVAYWDNDARKDLLVGQADGKVFLYLNVGTAAYPLFDDGNMLMFGPPGSKAPIDVGDRATPTFVDWDSDGDKDLVVGAMDGRIHVFNNAAGSGNIPDFDSVSFAQDNGSDLVVPNLRSSPVVLDLDGDGNKDLLTGDTNGQLLLYGNTGTNAAPSFSGYSLIEADGAPIDLLGAGRSRPFVGDWTGDGLLDVLIGYGDGQVHLYQGVPEPGCLTLLSLGAALVVRRRRRL